MTFWRALQSALIWQTVISRGADGFGSNRLSSAWSEVQGTLEAYSNHDWPLPKRAGSWVRIATTMALGIVWRDRNQSIHQSRKNLREHNCNNCSGTDFCLEFLLVLSFQTNPSGRFAVMIPTQVPTAFGNGQLTLRRPRVINFKFRLQ